MSDSDPKPPNPDLTIQPPPMVNPPCSRMDKSLKTKKKNIRFFKKIRPILPKCCTAVCCQS